MDSKLEKYKSDLESMTKKEVIDRIGLLIKDDLIHRDNNLINRDIKYFNDKDQYIIESLGRLYITHCHLYNGMWFNDNEVIDIFKQNKKTKIVSYKMTSIKSVNRIHDISRITHSELSYLLGNYNKIKY